MYDFIEFRLPGRKGFDGRVFILILKNRMHKILVLLTCQTLLNFRTVVVFTELLLSLSLFVLWTLIWSLNPNLGFKISHKLFKNGNSSFVVLFKLGIRLMSISETRRLYFLYHYVLNTHIHNMGNIWVLNSNLRFILCGNPEEYTC